MPDHPANKLTTYATEGDKNPDQKTVIKHTTQVALNNAWTFGSREYGLDFLERANEDDQRVMMAIEGKRMDQIVEMNKAAFMPYSVGTGPLEEFMEKPTEKRGKHRIFGPKEASDG